MTKKEIAAEQLLEFYIYKKNKNVLPEILKYLEKASHSMLTRLSKSFWFRTLAHLYEAKATDIKKFISTYHEHIENALIHQLEKIDKMHIEIPAPDDSTQQNMEKALSRLIEIKQESLSSLAAYTYAVYLAHYPEADMTHAFDGGYAYQQSPEDCFEHINMTELEKLHIRPTHFNIEQLATQIQMIALHRELFVGILNNLADPTANTPETKRAWIEVGKEILKLPEGTIKQIFERYGATIMASIDTNEMTDMVQETLKNIVKYGAPAQQRMAHLWLGAHDIRTAKITDDRQIQNGLKHFIEGDVTLAGVRDYLTNDDYYKLMIRNHIPEAFNNDTEKCQSLVHKFMDKFYEIASAKYKAIKDQRFNHPDKQDALSALQLIRDYSQNSTQKQVAAYTVICEKAKGETQYQSIKDVGAHLIIGDSPL